MGHRAEAGQGETTPDLDLRRPVESLEMSRTGGHQPCLGGDKALEVQHQPGLDL
jgi:hypothetical protein